MNKYLLGTVVVTVIVGGYFLVTATVRSVPTDSKPTEATPATEDEKQQLDTARVANLEFSYRQSPDGYVSVNDFPEDIQHRIDNVTLMNKSEYQALDLYGVATEYPPAISVSVYENKLKLEPQEWAETNYIISNYLLNDEEEAPAVNVSGAKGIKYSIDGLYLYDFYVLEYGDDIYVLSGSYYAAGDEKQKDFEAVIASVEFKP